MKESRVCGLLSILIQVFNRLVPSCPIVFITHVATSCYTPTGVDC